MKSTMIYTELSYKGMLNTFANTFTIPVINDCVKLNSVNKKATIQGVKLPGNLEVIFTEYSYNEDISFEHISENEERFLLWIDCSNNNAQTIEIQGAEIDTSNYKQSFAYLMNTLFPYKQFRSSGTKGHAIAFFIPNYLLQGFLNDYGKESMLAKFYALQNKGQSLIKLGKEEEKIVSSFFYQWHKYENTLSLAKYAYQLLEWYFTKLMQLFDEQESTIKLLPDQAQDLYITQVFIKQNLYQPTLNFSDLEKLIKTPINLLKKLFSGVNKQSIPAYFKETKLCGAMKLLATTDKTIADIALEFGYANPSNFATAFKKYSKLLPHNYRLKNRITPAL